MDVLLYDTTLRDGAQGEGVNFSCGDKLRITEKLAELGVAYVEGGWPGSNPKDIEYFERIRGSAAARRTTVVAFGSTRKAQRAAADDPQLRLLLAAETPAVAIFGKSWDLHVARVLRTTPDENLRMVRDSVGWLRDHGREVVYDAEHFFDGFRAAPDYALATLAAAVEGGAGSLTLCDTNGGALAWDVAETVAAARRFLAERGWQGTLGIHTHDDGGLGVANALAAVRGGCRLVQGTVNGYGERCGNADLLTVAADLELKMGLACLGPERLTHLTEVAHFVAELANRSLPGDAPYVGHSAFAHKGGTHVNAVVRCAESYQHVPPAVVGNATRAVVSELSGKDNIAVKRAEFGLEGLDRADERRVLEHIKALENRGFSFEGAEGSVALLLRRLRPDYRPPFELVRYHVVVDHQSAAAANGSSAAPAPIAAPSDTGRHALFAEATIKVRVGDAVFHTAAEGRGPVNALDAALRKALTQFYPELRAVHLTDYKVRIVDGDAATAAVVRLLLESTDGHVRWTTVGASSNIIEASWQALADSVEFALLGLNRPGGPASRSLRGAPPERTNDDARK